jgi:hypothetical protein
MTAVVPTKRRNSAARVVAPSPLVGEGMYRFSTYEVGRGGQRFNILGAG